MFKNFLISMVTILALIPPILLCAQTLALSPAGGETEAGGEGPPKLLYKVTGSGVCGVSPILSGTPGTSVVTKNISTTGSITSGLDLDETVVADTWVASVDLTVGTGGGPQNRIKIAISKGDSTNECFNQPAIQCSLIVDVNKGTIEEYMASISCPEIVFSDTDYLIFQISDNNGNQDKTVRYNNSATSDADTRMERP